MAYEAIIIRNALTLRRIVQVQEQIVQVFIVFLFDKME